MTDQELKAIEDRAKALAVAVLFQTPISKPDTERLTTQDTPALIAALREARDALRQNMDWLGPPPVDLSSFDSLRENAWRAGKDVLGDYP